jgi:hypothetical protein
MSSDSCPAAGTLPDSWTLPFNSKNDFVFVNSLATSDAAMKTCCSPSSVNYVNSCYKWCELPAKYTNTSAARHNAASAFASCLRSNGEEAPVVGTNIANAAEALPLSLKGVILTALAVGSLLHVL